MKEKEVKQEEGEVGQSEYLDDCDDRIVAKILGLGSSHCNQVVEILHWPCFGNLPTYIFGV